ncbi:MAG: DUF4386 domain-containing protein [Thermomicrobiales bacterium]
MATRQQALATGRGKQAEGPTLHPPSSRRAGAIAGISLLLMAVISMFSIIVTEMDSPSPALLRVAVVGWMIVVFMDIVVAWALGIIFRPVDAPVSQLAAWLRLAYSAVFLVGISFLSAGDREAFHHLWDRGLFLFGMHLLLIGWLAWRSQWLPRWLGVLVSVAGLGYTLDTVIATLATDPAFELAIVTFMGEPLLAIWLLMRAWRGGAAVRSDLR